MDLLKAKLFKEELALDVVTITIFWSFVTWRVTQHESSSRALACSLVQIPLSKIPPLK